VFPALFQVLAHALLFHPHDEFINSLMTMADMTFHDLAVEYSDSGAELLALLGKKDITVAMVQAGLLRASFLKSSGKVVEAWHVLGATIRDAQKLVCILDELYPTYLRLGSSVKENIPGSLVTKSGWSCIFGTSTWLSFSADRLPLISK
jgi:hypothetical protein